MLLVLLRSKPALLLLVLLRSKSALLRLVLRGTEAALLVLLTLLALIAGNLGSSVTIRPSLPLHRGAGTYVVAGAGP